MKKELEIKLIENYPSLFINKDNKAISLMYFGFSHDDGWYDIVNDLCRCIHEEIIKIPKEEQDKYFLIQVKEKFAVLEFYMSKTTDSMKEAISIARSKSAVTCEVTGEFGERENVKGWMKTLHPKFGRLIIDLRAENRYLKFKLKKLEEQWKKEE